VRNALPLHVPVCPVRWICLAGLVLATAFLFAAGVHAEPKFPELTGQIVDNAGLLTAEDRATILSDLKALEAKATDQLVVVTVPSLDGYEIEDYGYQLGRKWGIGQAGKNNGVLLIVAPKERKVRIEVGRGLEPIVTDLMSSLIIQNAILPEFRRGNFSGGIRAGARDVKDVLLGDAEAVRERAKAIGKAEGPDWLMIVIILFWLSIIAVAIWAQMNQAQQAPQTVGQRRRSRRDRSILTDPSVGSGTWGGGGWSGGGSGGGGWSGGGGNFGGGGSSGSW
jgi:uncharacterized protein